jgi:predicted hydrocarbon binding protein
MNEPGFSVPLLKKFVETLAAELGLDTLKAVFEKAGLPPDWVSAGLTHNMNEEEAAWVYSKLQSSMRVYYGRGARGTLLRIGSKLWQPMLDGASFSIKAKAQLMRALPASMRLKPALDILASILSVQQDNISVHTLDLDLLFVDHNSPTTLGQKEIAPICFVTQGLIRECLFWAAGHEFDIEETSCHSMGQKECEFKIITGAKA